MQNITVRINEDRRKEDNPLETAIRGRIAKLYNAVTGNRLHSVKRQVRMNVRPGSALVFVDNKPFGRFRFNDNADLVSKLRNGSIPMSFRPVK